MIRYTAGIVEWTIAELEDLDCKTRKLMTARHTLHPLSDIDRLYLPRRIWGRGLLQIRQTVEEEIRNLVNTSAAAHRVHSKKSSLMDC